MSFDCAAGKLAIGKQESAEAELAALKHHIYSYRAALNEEAVWLFLATLGCWSVTNHWLQIGAYLLTTMLFAEQFGKRVKETRSITALVADVARRVKELVPEGDTQKARLFDLSELQRNELSIVKVFRENYIFMLCWLFFCGSLFVAWLGRFW